MDTLHWLPMYGSAASSRSAWTFLNVSLELLRNILQTFLYISLNLLLNQLHDHLLILLFWLLMLEKNRIGDKSFYVGLPASSITSTLLLHLFIIFVFLLFHGALIIIMGRRRKSVPFIYQVAQFGVKFWPKNINWFCLNSLKFGLIFGI